MTKYSDEFKIKAVQMLLKDNTVESVTRMLNIPSHSTLCAWLAHYNHGGIKQLLHKNRSYSPDFKQKVLEHRWQHGLSLKETAALFSIPNFSTIYQWEKQYLAYGKSGLLPKKKGRPSMKYKPKKRKQKPEPTYLEQLEAENAFLKMENAFLKKYNALIQQEEEEERRKRQR